MTADLVTVPLKLLSLALQDLPALTPVLASYVPVFAAAIAFVRWNGGHIVLGEPAASFTSARDMVASSRDLYDRAALMLDALPRLARLVCRRQVEPRPDGSCRPSLVLPRLCRLLLLTAPPRRVTSQAKYLGLVANTEVSREKKRFAAELIFSSVRADSRAVASSARSWRSG